MIVLNFIITYTRIQKIMLIVVVIQYYTVMKKIISQLLICKHLYNILMKIKMK